MNNRIFTALLSTAALTATASVALADEAGTVSTSTSSKMRVQAQVELLPIGELEAGGDGESDSTDTAIAYGISAAFDYALTPYLSIGVAPRLVLNVDAKEDSGEEESDAKELDLRARILAHMPVAPKLEVFGYLSPGYSIVMFGDDVDIDNPSGFSLGGALGATYDVSPAMYVSGEVGYTKAFTRTDLMVAGQSFDVDLDLSYLHVGLGAGTRF